MKKERIEDALLKMGVSANLKGFDYITQALLLMDTEEWKYPKVIALYAKIGSMNKTTAGGVERCIRHAIETARSYRGHQDVVDHYMGFHTKGNLKVLSQMYLMLKREEEDEKSNT